MTRGVYKSAIPLGQSYRLRPRYTRGFLTRVSRLFGQSSLKLPVLVKTRAIQQCWFFSPASRVLPRSAVSVALVAVERGWVCEHSLTDTAELNMSSFLIEINIFASINIDYTNQIHYFQLSIYSI